MDPAAGLFRSTCSECGSSNLEWMPASELGVRVEANDALAWMGDEAGDAWLCRACGGFGVFGAGGGWMPF